MLKDPLSARKPAARHRAQKRRRKTLEYFFSHGEQLLGVVPDIGIKSTQESS
jgi:hypothetical protein